MIHIVSELCVAKKIAVETLAFVCKLQHECVPTPCRGVVEIPRSHPDYQNPIRLQVKTLTGETFHLEVPADALIDAGAS